MRKGSERNPFTSPARRSGPDVRAPSALRPKSDEGVASMGKSSPAKNKHEDLVVERRTKKCALCTAMEDRSDEDRFEGLVQTC